MKQTKRLRCIAALPYNPFFEEEIGRIRQQYAIPKDNAETKAWFKNLIKEHKRSTFAFVLKLEAERQREMIHLGHGLLFEILQEEDVRQHLINQSEEMSMLIETDIPLEKDMLLQLQRFNLPTSMYFRVLHYVLTNNKEEIRISRILPDAHCDYGLEMGEPTLRVIVTGLYPWTTREEWDDVWEGVVKDAIEDISAFLEGRKFKRKRPYDEILDRRFRRWWESDKASLDRQMKRWSEWYQLSEVERLGPIKAFEKWEREHPDQSGKFDQSTVTKAIREFRELITPI